jgi:4-amino-4-deoxy-L-arabinose transferase-like glycosyltransferase
MGLACFFLLWWPLARAFRRREGLSGVERAFYSGLIVFLELISVVRLAAYAHALAAGPVRLAFGGLLAAHAILAWRARRAAPEPGLVFARALWLPLGALVILYAWRLWLAWALPPNWDGLSYHLPMMLRWLQNRSFELAGSGMELPSHFPHNGELFGTWIALLGGGGVEAGKTAQIAAVVLLGAAAFLLGKQVAGERWAAAVALAAVSVPMVIFQSGEAYVDLFYTAFWVASLAGFFRAMETRSSWDWLAGALGFGLALGTKESVYFQFPLLLAAGAAIVSARGERPAPLFLISLGALVLWAGSASYLHNWLAFGNPFYPFQTKVGPWVLFTGDRPPGELNATHFQSWFVHATHEWLTYPWHETLRGRILYTTENGFGALFAAGWFTTPLTLYKAARARHRGVLLLNLILLVLIALFLTLHPVRMPRYIIFISILPLLNLAYLLSGLPGRAGRAAVMMWSTAILFSAAATVGAVFSNGAVGRAWHAMRTTGHFDRDAYFAERYGALGRAWSVINRTLSPGDVVVTNATDLLLPWAGTPARARLDVVFPEESDEPGYFGADTPDDWLALLARLNARYLALVELPWDIGTTVDAEMETIRDHPDRFDALGEWQDADFGRVRLFRVRPAKGV